MILARLLLFVALALVPRSAMALPESIQFDSFSEDPATQHTEGSYIYRIVPSTNDVWAYSTSGNPGSSLITGFDFPAPGDTFEFFRTDSGVFSLSSFDFASGTIGSTQSDTVSFIALNGVNETLLCGGITSSSPLYSTNSSCSPLSTMDHLLIRIEDVGGVWLHIDNIALDTVAAPEPASLLLLGAGLVGVVARSRKSKA